MRLNALRAYADPKAQLHRWYVEEGKSDREIGQILGITDVAVSYKRRQYGIATLGQDARRVQEGRPSLETATPEEFKRLLDAGNTPKDLAVRYGVTTYPIGVKLREWGLRVPTRPEPLGVELPAELLPLVIGTLLGDASIGYRSGGKRSQLSVGVSHGQYGYIRHVHARFGRWAGPLRATVGESKTPGKTDIAYSFTSRSHPAFRELRNRWYRDDLRGQYPADQLKAPPLEVFRSLADESLAYWYFDDGTYGDAPSIVAYFPLLDQDELLDAVCRGTRLGWYWSGEDAFTPGLRSLQLRSKDHEEFFSRVVAYATPDLAYKFPATYHERVRGTYVLPPDVADGTRERLEHYRIEQWRKLPSDAQEQWVQEVFRIYRRIGFPYVEQPEALTARRTLITLGRREEPLRDGVALKRSPVGVALCNAFMNHRYEAVVGGKSSLETFNDDEAFLKVILAQFGARSSQKVTPPRMRLALQVYGGNRTPSNFRPATMKSIVDALCPQGGVVWDPCAGYGGRMLGAVASARSVTYIGTEPSPQSVGGLQRLWAFIQAHAPGQDPNRVRILPTTAEATELEPESVDLVFTSPPYFRAERYVGGEQSHATYGNYPAWREGFLTALIRNAHRFLKPGGHFGLNVANVRDRGRRIPLVEDVDRIARSAGFRRHLLAWYPLGRFGPQRPDEPILVYTKSTEGPEPEWDLTTPHVTSSREVTAAKVQGQRERSRCVGCGCELPGAARVGRRCAACKPAHDHELAVLRRSQRSAATPANQTRTFVCDECKVPWETDAPGRFRWCPSCKPKIDERDALALKAKRTRPCQYRHCGKPFTDESSQNSAKFCSAECCRREKVCRRATSGEEVVFRADVEPRRTCKQCSLSFPPDQVVAGRCSGCRDGARFKVCVGCGQPYKDASPCNNRKRCGSCP